MNTQTLNIASTPNRTAPRGSTAAGALFAAAGIAIAKLFDRPQNGQLTLAQEADQVRAMADRLRQTEPGFAADLYAAAARHEMLGD